ECIGIFDGRWCLSLQSGRSPARRRGHRLRALADQRSSLADLQCGGWRTPDWSRDFADRRAADAAPRHGLLSGLAIDRFFARGAEAAYARMMKLALLALGLGAGWRGSGGDAPLGPA